MTEIEVKTKMSTSDEHAQSICYGNLDGDWLSLDPIIGSDEWLKCVHVRMQGRDQFADDESIVHVAVGLNRAQVYELWQKLGYLLTNGLVAK